MATSQKPEPAEKRAVISRKRRNERMTLVMQYQQLQNELRRRFPQLNDYIQEDIDRHIFHANRTRQSDRETVLKEIERWKGMSVGDLVEETGLHSASVRRILDELLERNLIGVRPHSDDKPGRPREIFFAFLS